MTTRPDPPAPPGAGRLRPLTPEDVAAASAWRYEGPWSVYDGSDVDPISSAKGYQAIVDGDGTFIGFVCSGADARVRGLDAASDLLDVGVGLAPPVVGQGRGAAILGPVLDSIAAQSEASSLRAVVQSWNERSLRLCARLGFREAGRHVAREPGGDVEYVLLVRAAGDGARGT
jgi:[ribosomal protein S18]-alanine N-acetyltransferase